MVYLAPSGRASCSGNVTLDVSAAKKKKSSVNTNLTSLTSVWCGQNRKWFLTSGSNRPLYAGLAVLLLFLSCLFVWISAHKQKDFTAASLPVWTELFLWRVTAKTLNCLRFILTGSAWPYLPGGLWWRGQGRPWRQFSVGERRRFYTHRNSEFWSEIGSRLNYCFVILSIFMNKHYCPDLFQSCWVCLVLIMCLWILYFLTSCSDSPSASGEQRSEE